MIEKMGCLDFCFCFTTREVVLVFITSMRTVISFLRVGKVVLMSGVD